MRHAPTLTRGLLYLEGSADVFSLKMLNNLNIQFPYFLYLLFIGWLWVNQWVSEFTKQRLWCNASRNCTVSSNACPTQLYHGWTRRGHGFPTKGRDSKNKELCCATVKISNLPHNFEISFGSAQIWEPKTDR